MGLLSSLLSRIRHRVPDREDRAGRGRLGEDAAVKLLRRKGYRIITRNWRRGRLELDIVARKDGVLVFVEVKARASDAQVSGYHAVGVQKKQALLQAVRLYLKGLPRPPKAYRLDIVEVQICDSGQLALNHVENIRIFPKNFA